MTKEWLVETHEDPLRAMRVLLEAVWDRVPLDGMVLPLRPPEGGAVRTVFVEDRTRLFGFDPLAPVMESNSAGEIQSKLASAPSATLGAAVRPCELRSLAVLCQQERISSQRLFRIGVDCLATFPEDEYERRAQSAEEAARMTKESLQFARQAGIAAYRYRSACQICPSPSPEEADLAFGLIGLPVQRYFLLMAKSEDLSDRLGLEALSTGPAPEDSLAQRRHAIDALKARRERKCDRVLSSLPHGLPQDVAELLDHLRSCQPCRDCLDACPTCLEVLELATANTKPLLEAAEHWVVLCSGCGMCDQACPRGYPLNAVIRRLARSLLAESLAA